MVDINPSKKFTQKEYMGSDPKQDEVWMLKALALAKAAARRGEVPVGAVLVCNDEVIAKAGNRKEALSSPLGHAELVVLHQASKAKKTWRLSDCTLYVTLEPCLMCAGALWQARIGRVVFGAADPKGGALGSLVNFAEDSRLNHRYPVRSGVLEKECAEVLKYFFKKRRAQNKAKGKSKDRHEKGSKKGNA